VAGLGLLAVVAHAAGPGTLTGVARVGLPTLAGSALGAGAGVLSARALNAGPVPAGLGPALGSGLLTGAIVLVLVLAVMMGTARRPLAEAWTTLRAPERQAPPDGGDAPRAPRPAREADRQEVHGE
jgi:putative peptidoglycan lipid II flippase